MTSSTDTSITYTVSWGWDFYRTPESPTASKVASGWPAPAAEEILVDPFWSAKVSRGIAQADAGQGTTLAAFRRSLDS